MATQVVVPVVEKKKLVRRVGKDWSQQVRRAVQGAFLALNVWIGIEFLMWVRYFESGGLTRYVERPAGVDGWLPIAGLMNMKYFATTHSVPVMHPAAMVLGVVFLLSSLLWKKTFCSWLCPVGTLSEYLWKLGRKVFKRSLVVPKWLDIPLRSLKYLLLAFFLFIVVSLSAEALQNFLLAPFGVIADVKMLNFFRHMGVIGVAVVGALMLLSVVIQNFWCRFLCPYGALMGIVSVASPVKVRRDGVACIDCGKCAKACPSHLLVDVLVQVRSVECTGCLECVAVCPAEGALEFALPGRRVVAPWAVAAGLAVVFFGLIGVAKATGHWQTPVSREIYMQLVPHADEYGH